MVLKCGLALGTPMACRKEATMQHAIEVINGRFLHRFDPLHVARVRIAIRTRRDIEEAGRKAGG
jgi:hypothetical protein